jgi:hypothetical protein
MIHFTFGPARLRETVTHASRHPLVDEGTAQAMRTATMVWTSDVTWVLTYSALVTLLILSWAGVTI